jgi:uncharacterized protein
VKASLRISRDLALPLDFATKTAAILAQRRKGKTYAASVIAEEMVAARQPFVALDPTGAWWGLRASADGESDGLPVVILGGQHADLPLDRTTGRLVADLVVDEPGFYVVDFSMFESGEAERQFAVDFAERLYRAKGQPGKDFPLHLFVDEADRFIPQTIRKGTGETSPRLLGAFEAIVRRGGLRGLGSTLISQRAAVVNKNVLEMIDVLIVLRTIGPNDRDSVDGYVKAHGSDEQRRELLGSLASLALGEAWVWEPGAEPSLFERVRIRERRTFNSSATPKPGERRVEPRRLAPVDLEKYRERMAATIEKAKADDPRELRKALDGYRRTVLDLTRKLEERPAAPAFDAAVLREVAEVVDRLVEIEQELTAKLAGMIEEFRSELVERFVGGLDERLGPIRAPLDRLADLLEANAKPSAAARTIRPDLTPPPLRYEGDSSGLPPMVRKFLTVLAQHRGEEMQKRRITTLAGYQPSGATSDAFAEIVRNGWATGETTAHLRITDAGFVRLGKFEPLPKGEELRRRIMADAGPMVARFLDVLFADYPEAVRKGKIVERAGYKASGATSDAFAYLVRAGYAEGKKGAGTLRAAPALFE